MKRPLKRIWRVASHAREIARGIPVHLAQPRSAGPPLPRRIAQQAHLLLCNAITAENYYAYTLHSKSAAEQHAFVGDFERWRWGLAANHAEYLAVIDDKMLFNRYIQGAGVRGPRLLAVVGQGTGLRNAPALTSWLAANRLEHVFLKPARGRKGVGILGLGARLEALTWERVPTGTIGTADIERHLDALPNHRRWIIEERLWPHPALARFSSIVLHTARIVTALDDAQVLVVAGALRIAVGDRPTDNLSQGNLVAPIDLASGRLGPAVYKHHGNERRLTHHPVSGGEIAGHIVPHWAAALDTVDTAARLLPWAPLLGWDVALTPTGPVIVEANALWDPDVTQLASGTGLLAAPFLDYMTRHGLLAHLGLGLTAHMKQILWPSHASSPPRELQRPDGAR